MKDTPERFQRYVGQPFTDTIAQEIALMPRVKRVRVHRRETGKLIDPLTLEACFGRATIYVVDGVVEAVSWERAWGENE